MRTPSGTWRPTNCSNAFRLSASGWFTTPVTGSVSATDLDAVDSLTCSGAGLADLVGIGGTAAGGSLTVDAEGESAVVRVSDRPDPGADETLRLQA